VLDVRGFPTAFAAFECDEFAALRHFPLELAGMIAGAAKGVKDWH
jgi:hypothetical protein